MVIAFCGNRYGREVILSRIFRVYATLVRARPHSLRGILPRPKGYKAALCSENIYTFGRSASEQSE